MPGFPRDSSHIHTHTHTHTYTFVLCHICQLLSSRMSCVFLLFSENQRNMQGVSLFSGVFHRIRQNFDYTYTGRSSTNGTHRQERKSPGISTHFGIYTHTLTHSRTGPAKMWRSPLGCAIFLSMFVFGQVQKKVAFQLRNVQRCACSEFPSRKNELSWLRRL